jgi:hypothetical protein
VRLKLEIAGGIVIAVLLVLFGIEQYQKAVGAAVAEQVAQHDREADAKLDTRLKSLEQADEKRQQDYEAKSAALKKDTPQQIVVKLPEYVPQATAPVQVLKADSPVVQQGHAQVGDAIVPAADIKPIAQAPARWQQVFWRPRSLQAYPADLAGQVRNQERRSRAVAEGC